MIQIQFTNKQTNKQTNKVKEAGIDEDCMKEMNERTEERGKGDCFDESVSLKK